MQVLQKALSVFGLSCQNLDSPECSKSQEHPENEIAFICNLRVKTSSCASAVACQHPGDVLTCAESRLQSVQKGTDESSTTMARWASRMQIRCLNTAPQVHDAGILTVPHAHSGALVLAAEDQRTVVELQQPASGPAAAVPVLPVRLPGHAAGPGLQHLCRAREPPHVSGHDCNC